MQETVEKALRIDGWMSRAELEWIYGRAASMDSIIEIGAWCGRTTNVLCEACSGMVYSIDHFKGSKEHQYLFADGKRDIFKEYRENTAECANLITIVADSGDVAEFLPITADMLFIDGSHDYESVMADLEAWMPRIKKLIAGHDKTEGGVGEAIEDTFKDKKIGYGEGSIWYVEVGG